MSAVGGTFWLRGQGLTNHDSEDIGALAMGQRRAPAAFCSSEKCTTKTGRSRVRKFMQGYMLTQCPDCGHALYYQTIKHKDNPIYG